jgi:hypothetical protein
MGGRAAEEAAADSRDGAEAEAKAEAAAAAAEGRALFTLPRGVACGVACGVVNDTPGGGAGTAGAGSNPSNCSAHKAESEWRGVKA